MKKPNNLKAGDKFRFKATDCEAKEHGAELVKGQILTSEYVAGRSCNYFKVEGGDYSVYLFWDELKKLKKTETVREAAQAVVANVYINEVAEVKALKAALEGGRL